jgi:mono/diheme cytochrome c family protein
MNLGTRGGAGGMGRIGGIGAFGIALCAIAAVARVDAHKPVTSKYTFSEDVYPIVKANCGGCHVAGGIAPMSLLTYEDARPWAESIRLELTSGRMPPWYGDPSVAPLRDVHALSPRDLDVVLTWVSGGTPPGVPARPSAGAAKRGWLKGRPDIVLPLPSEVSLPAEKSEDAREFVLRDAGDRDRVIAFADLLPGNPAVVHDATIFTRRVDAAAPSAVLAAWLPGGAAVAPGAGLGFVWRAGEQLVVRIHYKKNWKLENKAASDRSSVGLYLAKSAATRAIRGVALRPGQPVALEEPLEGLAVRTAGTSSDVRIVVDAIRPDGSRMRLAGFSARAGWDQRYWLARPVDLPKGTRIEVTTGTAPLASMQIWLDAAGAS